MYREVEMTLTGTVKTRLVGVALAWLALAATLVVLRPAALFG